MGSAWRYWHLVRLNGSGGRQDIEIPTAKAWFQQQFPQLRDLDTVPDTVVQRQLMNLISSQPTSKHSETTQQADCCLRCFISHQIDRTCFELVRRFGQTGGFNQMDLLAFVLDDFELLPRSNSQPRTSYQSLADKILQTFNPERAQLSTWTKQVVKSHPELSRFLWECGVHLETNWAILNHYQPKQLEHLLTRHYGYTSTEAKPATEILDSYQTVYLSDRLQQNGSRRRSRCQPPTSEQLNRIIADLKEKGINNYTPSHLLEQLESLAGLIRRSRQPKQEPPIDENYPQPASDEAETEMQEFLQRFRQLLVTHLDRAIKQVLNDRLSYLSKRKKPKDQIFLQALRLNCQGQAMKEIAKEIGLTRQDQVTRLLKLKSLRQDVQQRLLVTLKEEVIQLAGYYTDLLQLKRLEQALATEIDRIMAEAEREMSTPNCSRDSLFTRRLCRHL
ncbi:MAG: hypothetical protein WBA13_17345 [Microcoleaceae cyanobacterium]